jgi:hypothetical protein
MLMVHHLSKPQSERIVWLCEELETPYHLKRYAREAATMLAPTDYKALHPTAAPRRWCAPRQSHPCHYPCATITWRTAV